MILLQYTIAVCPTFTFPRILSRELRYINYYKVLFLYNIIILVLFTSIITIDPYVY